MIKNSIVFCLLSSIGVQASINPSTTLDNQIQRTYSFYYNPNDSSPEGGDAINNISLFSSHDDDFDYIRNHPMNQCIRNSVDSLEGTPITYVESCVHVETETQTAGILVKDQSIQTDTVKKKKHSFCDLMQMLCCCSWC